MPFPLMSAHDLFKLKEEIFISDPWGCNVNSKCPFPSQSSICLAPHNLAFQNEDHVMQLSVQTMILRNTKDFSRIQCIGNDRGQQSPRTHLLIGQNNICGWSTQTEVQGRGKESFPIGGQPPNMTATIYKNSGILFPEFGQTLFCSYIFDSQP